MKNHSGYSLVEIILIIGLTMFLFTIALDSIIGSSDQLNFINSYEKVLDMVRQGRSLAIAGKAQLDYTDFDQDGCTYNSVAPGSNCGAPDYVTPANYGINFFSDMATNTNTVTFFVDNHGDALQEKSYNPANVQTDISFASGGDMILETYSLPKGINLDLPQSEMTIFYSPIFADIGTDFTIGTDSMIRFGLEQPNSDVSRTKCFQIHQLAGVPEESSTCP